jgi:hypothetical protein
VSALTGKPGSVLLDMRNLSPGGGGRPGLLPSPDGRVRSTPSRERLRRLDRCLDELESAHERGETVVSLDMARRLATHVPGLRPAMTINQALKLVFLAQEPRLRTLEAVTTADGERQDVVLEGGGPIEEAAARDLTERIRGGTRQVCLLLLEAHQRRAWLALGYRSWEQYVGREFSMSRSRSYELLDQAKAIRLLQEAACLSGVPDISAHAAAQIKPDLGEVVRMVRTHTSRLPEDRAMEVLTRIVNERVHERRSRRPSRVSRSEAHSLRQAIEVLAAMPPVDEVLERRPGASALPWQAVRDAADWLAELAARLEPNTDALRGA